MAAAAFSVCAMVAAATTLTPDDAPSPAAREVAVADAKADEAELPSRADTFVDGLDAAALERAALAITPPEPEPSEKPSEPPAEPAEPVEEAKEEEPAKPASPSPRRSGPRVHGSSQFLAALVKRPPDRQPGTLVARARGGTCRFWIDGVVSGEGRVVKVPAKPGRHNVACRGADGRPRVQAVDVRPGGIAVAAFHLGG